MFLIGRNVVWGYYNAFSFFFPEARSQLNGVVLSKRFLYVNFTILFYFTLFYFIFNKTEAVSTEKNIFF